MLRASVFSLLVGGLLGLVGAVLADSPSQLDPLKQLKDGSERYNQGRAGFLPTGAGEKPYLTLTVSDDWESNPFERQVIGWFEANPRLADIKRQCYWNSYTLSNPHFRDRLAADYGTAVPIVTLQRGGYAGDPQLGKVYVNITAVSFPKTAGELADELDKAIDAFYSPPPVANSGRESTQIEREGDCHPDDPNCPFWKKPNRVPARVVPETRVRPAFMGIAESVVAVLSLCVALVAVCGVLFYALRSQRSDSV